MGSADAVKEVLALIALSKAEYKQRFDEEPTEEMVIFMADRAHHRLLSDDIQAQRKEKKFDSKPTEEKPATQKQLEYIQDLGGSTDGITTSAQASKEIERLRKK